MRPIRVHVHGAGGRMGQMATAVIQAEPDLQLSGTSGRHDDLDAVLGSRACDVLVEFTTPTTLAKHLEIAIRAGVPVVSGTTGLAPEKVHELGELAAGKGLGVVLAPNFALGVVLLQRFAREAVRWLPQVEIIELHHDAKVDAPSGTALHTARMLGPLRHGRPVPCTEAPSRGEIVAGIPVHSIRLPGLLAHQEVLFGGPGQLLTLRHDAYDRRAYAPGLLLAIRKVRTLRGLVDSLEPLLDGAP